VESYLPSSEFQTELGERFQAELGQNKRFHLMELVTQGLQKNQDMSPLLAQASQQTLAAQARGNPLQPITNSQSIPASEPNEKAQTPVVPAVDVDERVRILL